MLEWTTYCYHLTFSVTKYKKKFKQTGYNNSQTSLLTKTNQQTNTKFKYKLKSAKTSAG